MANVYYSTQWEGLSDGTVVAVKDGTAVIGTDAFATYSEAKAAGDVVLCDVFASNEWAGTVESTVDVVLEGDTYTLTVGEEAFATLEAAAFQVATNQYGGVETYGDNDGVTAYGYVSGAWSDLPDYTVVTTGGTVWDEDGAAVSGGTAVIGVNAFATYTEANDKLDVYWNESQMNGVAASSDIYLDSTWISTSYSEGETITVTLNDGSEITATFGENAVLLADATAATARSAFEAQGVAARQKGSALYITSGTFLQEDATSNGGDYTWGAKTVVSNAYIQRISAGTPYVVKYDLAPELYLLSGAKTSHAYVAGHAGGDKAYLYVGNDAYAATITAAQFGSSDSVGIVEIDVDGGTFGAIQGTNQKITGEFNVNLTNGATGSLFRVGVNSGESFDNLACDINLNVTDSTLSSGVTISHRDYGRNGWYATYNVSIKDVAITIKDSYVNSIGNGTSAWSFKSYTITLDGGSVTTLNPRENSGDYYANYCNVMGGTATITGGSFTATAGGASKGDNTETNWIDADVRFLTLSSTKVTYNDDGTITVANGVFYNANGATNQKWIVGGTATFVGGTHNLVTLSVTGDSTSTVDSMTGVEAITIDATAQLSLKCSVASATVITVNAEDLSALIGKVVLTTTGSINSTDITLLENGEVPTDYYLVNSGTTLSIAKKPVYYSALWADLADGDTVVVKGDTLTIGVNAFNDYSLAVAGGLAQSKDVQDLDTYFNSAWVAGNTVTIQARGGSYTAVVSATASSETNAFTTQSIAKSAHTSYYPAGGVVIDGATVTGRTWLNSTQANPYILKNYISTGGGDQGFCISAVSTSKREGGYAVVGEGSKLNVVYMGERNGASTLGDLKLEVVDGGSIAELYTGALYDGQVGTSEDYANVTITIDGGTVKQLYGAGSNDSMSYANVTVNAVNTTGYLIYGGGSAQADKNAGTMTINLNNASYTSHIAYYNPNKGSATCTQGAFTINVLGGTSTVGGRIALRNTDTITIDADALLVTSGVVTSTSTDTGFTGTITVDATDFSLGSAEQKLVFKQTALAITANFNLLGDTEKYAIKQVGMEVYIAAIPVVYSRLWADKEAGETVVISGSTYTIGTDAFGNYNDAAAAAVTLDRPVSICDAFYSTDWSGKSAGDKVTVTLDGTDVELTIGKNAFTGDSAASIAAGTTGAMVVYGGSFYLPNADRRCYFTQDGQTVIWQGSTVTFCDWNAGFYSNGYTGTMAFTDKSSIKTVNGYSCGKRSDKDMTFVVDDSSVESFYLGSYTSSGSSSIEEGTGKILWDGTHVTNYVKIANGSKVTSFLCGGNSTGGISSGDTIGEITDSTVTTLCTTSSGATGNFLFTVTGSTISTLTSGAAAGDRYIGLTITGGTSFIGQFGGEWAHATGVNLTINATDRSALVIGTSYQMPDMTTITIDVDNFQFNDGEKSFTLLSTNGYLGNKTVSVTGTAIDEFDIIKTSSSITIEKKKAYFSVGWADLEDGTIVNTPAGTATIGEYAFGSYAAATAKCEDVVFCDTYWDSTWSGLSVGDEVTIEIPGNTFSAKIDNTTFCTSLGTAKSNFTEYSGSAVVIAGGTIKGSRTTYLQLEGKNTEIYNYQMYSNKAQLDESPVIVVLDTTVAGTIKTGSVTLGANNKLTTVYGNRNGTTAADAHFSVTVKEGTYVEYYIAANWGGSLGSTDTYTVDETTKKLIWAGEADHSVVTVNVEGGSVNSIAPTIYSGNGYTGDFVINVSGGIVNAIQGKVAGTPNANFYITLSGGTVKAITPGTGNGDRYFEINVTDDAQVGTFGAGNYAMTIDANATLTVTGGTPANVGTITIDAADCDYSKAQYLLVSGVSAISNDFTVVNDDPTKNYSIVKAGNNVYYQAPTVYFSVTWAGLESGTKVTVAGEEYTIGTDAFASYDLAVAAGAKLINSADTYLNSSYNATDPIEIGNYTATFGVDAFADQASAVATAKTMGGALDVTGWTAALTGLDGIENVYISNAEIGSGASISIQTGTATEAATLNVSIADSNANYVNIVNKGSVTGDVNVTAADVTTYNAFYVVSAGNSVGGDINVTISGKSYLTKGLYTLDDNATAGGDLTITVAGGEIYRKGIVNFGTVDGTSSVTVTGDATISSIMDTFDTVTINENVTLNYGIGLDGDWKNSYLYGFRNLVNNGTLNYNAELGQNAYAMLYETLSGTGTIELGNNVEFVEGGTTYVAELQEQVLVNSDWSGKSVFDVIDVDGGTVIYGVSAFATKETAQTSGLTSDATTFIEYGQVIEGAAYGEDGHLGFAGGTVTGTAYAGEAITEAGGTITQSSELIAMSTSDAAGDYASLIGGYDIQEYADTTIAANSSLVVGGAGDLTGKALVGGSYITASAVDWTGTSSVTMTSGSFSNALIGGALVNGENASISGTLATDVTVSGGTVKVLGGGCYLQNGGSIDVSGTSNVTLSNCTVVGSVFGGNYANKLSVSTKDTSLWNGNTSITIDATESVVIGGNLVAGSYGTGKVSGNTTITLSGSGDNLSIGGIITGDSSGGNDSASGKFVTGTRTLNFTNFSGSLGSATKKVTGFDAVALSGSTVSLAGYGMLKSVSDWQITDSTLDWTKGANDFSGDQLTLTYSGALTDEWTVFQLTDKLTTGWNEFTTDDSGTPKIILSINGEGTIAAFDETANAYLGTISDVNYKFYLDTEDNALKVAKLA